MLFSDPSVLYLRVKREQMPKQNDKNAGPAIDMSLIDPLVGYNLRRAAARQRERFRNVFSKFDILPVQLTTLGVILQSGGIGQSALGKALDMERANVVKLLDELQSRELIERRPSAGDRRAYEVHLTPKGTQFTRKLLALHDKLEADLAAALGPEDLKRLVDLLRKLRSVNPDPNPV